MNARAKFRGDQDSRYDGQLTWPGSQEGYPILGRAPEMMRQDEYEQITHACSFKCQMYRTWIPDEVAEYRWVMDRVANQLFILRANDRQWDAAKKGYHIWLEWAEVYGLAPNSTQVDPMQSLTGGLTAPADGTPSSNGRGLSATRAITRR